MEIAGRRGRRGIAIAGNLHCGSCRRGILAREPRVDRSLDQRAPMFGAGHRTVGKRCNFGKRGIVSGKP
jgi:hypothetical protein